MIKHPDVCEGCLPAEAVVLNRNEIAARLHASRTFEDPLIDRCLARLLSVVSYKYCYVRLPVSFPEANLCNFGFAEAASADLAKNLKGCREVFLFAVTAGIGVGCFPVFRLPERQKILLPMRFLRPLWNLCAMRFPKCLAGIVPAGRVSAPDTAIYLLIFSSLSWNGSTPMPGLALR